MSNPALQVFAGLALPAIAAAGLFLLKLAARRAPAKAAEAGESTPEETRPSRRRKVAHPTFPDVWAAFGNLAAVAALGLAFLLCLILLGGWSR